MNTTQLKANINALDRAREQAQSVLKANSVNLRVNYVSPDGMILEANELRNVITAYIQANIKSIAPTALDWKHEQLIKEAKAVKEHSVEEISEAARIAAELQARDGIAP